MALPPTWNLFGEDHLPHRLLLLAKMIDRQTARQLQSGFGLSLAEWRVLAFVCTSGSASASEVSSAFGVDRAEVSRAIATLLSKALVQRGPAPDHGKKLILDPTPAGSKLFAKARRARHAYFEKILSALSGTERMQFDGMMEKLANTVDFIASEG